MWIFGIAACYYFGLFRSPIPIIIFICRGRPKSEGSAEIGIRNVLIIIGIRNVLTIIGTRNVLTIIGIRNVLTITYHKQRRLPTSNRNYITFCFVIFYMKKNKVSLKISFLCFIFSLRTFQKSRCTKLAISNSSRLWSTSFIIIIFFAVNFKKNLESWFCSNSELGIWSTVG